MTNPAAKPEESTAKKERIHAFFRAVQGHLAFKGLMATFALIGTCSYCCVREVRDYDIAVSYRFGKADGIAPPGLNIFIPLIDDVYSYDARHRTIVIKDKAHADQGLEGIEARTKEGYMIGCIATIFYSLDKCRFERFVRTYGQEDSDDGRRQIEKRIEAEVRHAMQSLVPQYKIEYLLAHRAELENNVLATIQPGTRTNSDADIPSCEQEGSRGYVVEPGKQPGLIVSLPEPFANERLKDLGLLVQSLNVEFVTPDDFRSFMAKKNSLVAETELTEQEIEVAITNAELVSRQGEVEVARAESDARAESIRLSEMAKASAHILFLERWNGILPSTLILAKDELSGAIIEEAILSRTSSAGEGSHVDSVSRRN